MPDQTALKQTPLNATHRDLGAKMVEAGGVIDDLILYFMDESWFRLVVNAGTAEKDLAWMEKMNADWGMGLTLTPRRDLAMIAIQGPNAVQGLNEALPGVDSITANLKPFNAAAMGEMFIARTGYTGEDGFEVMVPAKAAPFLWKALMEAGGTPIGLGARDTPRLRRRGDPSRPG